MALKGFETWLESYGLPTIPLVAVTSSQAVIGAIVGIVLAKRGRGINMKVLGKVSSGWITTPIIAAVISFIGLYFAQNVFEQKVVEPINETRIEIQYKNTQIDTLTNSIIDEFDLQENINIKDSTK